MKIAAKLFPFMCALAPGATAAEPQLRPKDAAEAVQEGNVRNWVEYYERQRRENANRSTATRAEMQASHRAGGLRRSRRAR